MENLNKGCSMEITDDTIDEMVVDLKRQIDADGDKTISLREVEEYHRNQNIYRAIEAFRKHFGNDIILMGTWDNPRNKRQLEDDELLLGEISAIIYEIGHYTVRSAEWLYKDSYHDKPADMEDIIKMRKRTATGLGDFDIRSRMACVISAKHNSDPYGIFANEFKDVCRAVYGRLFGDHISYICALKKNAFVPDELAGLYVQSIYCGDCRTIRSCYKIDPHGDAGLLFSENA